jgi:urease accessory protein
MADSFLAHDPAAGGEVFSVLYNEIRIEDLDENLLCLDRNSIYGDAFIDRRVGIMGSNGVLATFLVLNSSLQCEPACTALRDSLQAHANVYAGVSTLPNQCGVWARVLSPEAVASRAALNELWRAARKLLVGSYPGIRRK